MQGEEIGRDERLVLLYILLNMGEGGTTEIDTENLTAIGLSTEPEKVLNSLEEKGLIEIKTRVKSRTYELPRIIKLLDALVTGHPLSTTLVKEYATVLLFLDLYERRDAALRSWDGRDTARLRIAARIDEMLEPYRRSVRSTNLVSRLRPYLKEAEDLLEYEEAILCILPVVGRDALMKPLTYDSPLIYENIIEEVAKEGIYVLDDEALYYRLKELEEYLKAVKEALKEGNAKEQEAATLLSGLISDKNIIKSVAEAVTSE